MFSNSKYRDIAKVLMAGCAFLGLSSAAWADQTHVAYNIAGGATLAVLVPATNTPVSFTCVQNTEGNRGVGQATLLRVAPASFLEWVGSDIATGAISSGFSSTPGTHIVYCDYIGKYLDVQVLSDTQIQLKNTSGAAMTGEINFVW
ncbi:MAG TPA: hypothetical protein VK753_08370 [Xanthomonadaceae bacterium]|jgi:hypothetical protein|nr:hypothetical protein [Xanthomonadaceae bacterium]